MQSRIVPRALLACGILASLTYAANPFVLLSILIDIAAFKGSFRGLQRTSPPREWVWLNAWRSTVINSGRQCLPSSDA
jgi:hypothetical protein